MQLATGVAGVIGAAVRGKSYVLCLFGYVQVTRVPSRHSFLRSSADRRERALMAAEQGERKNQRIAVDFRFLRRLGTRTQPEYISVHPQRKSYASSYPLPSASRPSASQS